MTQTAILRRFALTGSLLLAPILAAAQSISLTAPAVVGFHSQLERLNFHTSCSSPLEGSAGGRPPGQNMALTAVLIRRDGSELGRVENVECATQGGFSSLDIRAELNAAGEATIFVNDLAQGSLETDRGRVTFRLAIVCGRTCPKAAPIVLDGFVIGRDSGETRAHLRYELDKVYVVSYTINADSD